MWERVVGLRGKTLETLGRPRPFTIVEVTQNGLEVRVSTGNVRYIPRPNVESSWAQLLRNKELTLDDIRENHTKANPAYVAAVLAEMPGVTKKTGPSGCPYGDNHETHAYRGTMVRTGQQFYRRSPPSLGQAGG